MLAMTALTLLIGLLILQALAYGLGFLLDPASNAGEFGYEVAEPVDALTVALVRVVGISMIGAAALLALSVILVWRGVPAGTYIASVIGAIYIAVSLLAADAGSWWDAGFYGITGVALVALSSVVRWLQGGQSDGGGGG